MNTLKADKTEAQLILQELRALRNEVKNNTAIMMEIRCLLDPACDDGSDEHDDDDDDDDDALI